MKTKIVAMVLALCSLPAIAAAQNTYVLNWFNPNISYPVCSATLNTWCATGMSVFETVGTTKTTITSSLLPTATTFVFPTYPTAGQHTYSVVENFKDLLGAAQATAPATATLTVPSLTGPPPNPVTGLTGTAQ